MTPFETRLARDLRSLAEPAASAVDPVTIASIARAGRRSRTSRSRTLASLEALVWGRSRRPVAILVLVVVMVAALAGLMVVVGGLTPQLEHNDNGVVQPSAPSASPTGPAALPGQRALVTVDGDIFLADLDGTDAVKIADGEPYVDQADNLKTWTVATWSSTGRYLAASQGEDAVILRPDGTEVDRHAGSEPIWAPVGDRYLLSSDNAIEVHDVGSELAWAAPVPKGAMLSDPPTWSPDGKRFAVEVCSPCNSSDQSGPVDLWVYTVGSTEPTVLTHSPNDRESHPVWAPDGTRIAFWRSTPCIDGVCGYDIYDVSVDGGDPVALTSDHVSAAPLWSPDSRHLAYLHAPVPQTGGTETTSPFGTSGPSNVRSIELDGTGIAVGTSPVDVTPLTEGEADFPLGWSRDGSRLSFFHATLVAQDEPSVGSSTWTVASDGSDPRQVVAAGRQTWWDWPKIP